MHIYKYLLDILTVEKKQDQIYPIFQDLQVIGARKIVAVQWTMIFFFYSKGIYKTKKSNN